MDLFLYVFNLGLFWVCRINMFSNSSPRISLVLHFLAWSCLSLAASFGFTWPLMNPALSLFLVVVVGTGSARRFDWLQCFSTESRSQSYDFLCLSSVKSFPLKPAARSDLRPDRLSTRASSALVLVWPVVFLWSTGEESKGTPHVDCICVQSGIWNAVLRLRVGDFWFSLTSAWQQVDSLHCCLI